MDSPAPESSPSTAPQMLLSVDAILAFAFLGVYIALYRDPKGVVLSALLILYIVVDIFWPWQRLADHPKIRHWAFLAKLTLLLLAISLITLLPTLLLVIERLQTGSPLLISDSMAQIEVGLGFLQQGLNPYAQDFTNTIMGQVPFDLSGITQNPGLQHFAYLPMFLEFSFPFYATFVKFLGWWDQRVLYTLMLLVSLGTVTQLSREPASKLSLLMLVGLNPMMMPSFSAGMSEVFPLMWLVLSALFFNRGRMTWGWIMLAIAVASKQTAWFFAVFAITQVLCQQLAQGHLKRLETIKVTFRQAWPALLILALSFLPFVVWNAHAFAEDTFEFLVGGSSTLAVIAGVGLGGLLLSLGVIHSAVDSYPFSIWQLVFGGPLLVGLLYHQYRYRDPRMIWVYGACLGVVLTFLSRVFADRYFGFYLAVAALGALADAPTPAPKKLVEA
jgi:hypothetical protein